MRDLQPAATLDDLDWRDGPPDAEGHWYVRHPNGAVTVCDVLCPPWTLPLYSMGGWADAPNNASQWPAGWRCAPVVTPRAVAERVDAILAERCRELDAEMRAPWSQGVTDAGDARSFADDVVAELRERIRTEFRMEL